MDAHAAAGGSTRELGYAKREDGAPDPGRGGVERDTSYDRTTDRKKKVFGRKGKKTTKRKKQLAFTNPILWGSGASGDQLAGQFTVRSLCKLVIGERANPFQPPPARGTAEPTVPRGTAISPGPPVDNVTQEPSLNIFSTLGV